MYTLAKCRKYVPGFSLPGFKADVLRIYEDACSGIARGDRTLLRQVQCNVHVCETWMDRCLLHLPHAFPACVSEPSSCAEQHSSAVKGLTLSSDSKWCVEPFLVLG